MATVQTPSAPAGMPKELKFTIGDRMVKAMKYAEFNVGSLAAELEVSRNTLSNWLNDRVTVRPMYLRVFAQITGVPLQWLRTGIWTRTT